MCPTCFPRLVLPADASLPSTGSSGASSPASTVLSKRYDFLPPIPPHFVTFVGRYLQRSLVLFAPRWTSAPPKPGVGDPVSPAGTSLRKRQDLPSSWRTPIVRLHMFHTDAGRIVTPDHFGAATWPLVIERQRLPRKVFRRSIAWLSDSLSTLRRAGRPVRRKTRFQPLVRRYWTGFPPAGFRRKVSECFVHLSLLPQACLAQTDRPLDRTTDAPLA